MKNEDGFVASFAASFAIDARGERRWQGASHSRKLEHFRGAVMIADRLGSSDDNVCMCACLPAA